MDLVAVLEQRSEVLHLLHETLAGDPGAALANAENWGKRKGDHPFLFTMLLSLLRDVSITRAGGHESQLMHTDIREILPSLVTSAPTPAVWEIFESVHLAQEAIAHNVNPQLAFEVMFFKIGDTYERARQRDRERQRYAIV